MKKLLTLVLCWLIAYTAMAETTFKAKTAASVAGGYVTSLNKIDGSFEDGETQWSTSVGTIVRTSSTEMQGNYVGVWSGTGTGTLDLLWTATASNTYELSAQIKLDVPSDYTLCGVVNGIETGCKVLSGYVANKIYKASVFADSVLGTSFYLRLKHTGAGAFSATVDDGKIEPWTPQAVNLVVQEGYNATYTSYAATTDAGLAYKFNFSTGVTTTLADLLSYNPSSMRFTAKRNSRVHISTSVLYTLGPAFLVKKVSDNSQLMSLQEGGASSNGYYRYQGSRSFDIKAGESFVMGTASDFGSIYSLSSISITATAISDNVVQSWQPSGSLGELKFLPQNIAPQGFIPALGSSIGKTAGTYQGDAYYDLYKVLWTQSSVTAGEPYVISSAKGADAATDWAANKTITIDVSGLVVRAYKSGTTAAVGAKQSDAFQGHVHSFASGSTVPNAATTYVVTSNSPNATGAVGSPISDGTNGTPRTSSETRMTNIAQYAFIRYGNDAPTLLALPTSKENVFSAKISSTGTRTGQNIDWINSVTVSDTSLYTIDITKLGLSVPPQVNANITGTWTTANAPRWATVQSVSSSSIVIRTHSLIEGLIYYEALPFEIKIQKQSPDYTPQGVVPLNAPAAGMNYTDGAPDRVLNFSFSYGTTNATTVCSASPCSYLDQIGNYVTTVERTAQGKYRMNTSKTFSKLKCWGSATYIGVYPMVVQKDSSTGIDCSNCNSLTWQTNNSSTGVLYDSTGTISCQGQ